MNALDKLKASIQKNVKGVHTSVLSESDIASNRFWVKTPALDLNRILSGSLHRGIQSRNLVAIVGPEHTMKSSFMVLCMAEAQRQGYTPVIIDTEGGISDEFCKRWGLDPSGVLYNYTPYVHQVMSIMAQIKETGDEGFVIGLDSVGGLDRYKAYKDALDGTPKQDQGLLQKEIRSLLKLYLNICVGQNSLGIACGHMYGMPSAVPMPDQIGGGKAMKLLPSVLISLKKEHIKDGTTKEAKVIGSKITATTLKNRMYPPFQQATVMLDYEKGVQPYAGLLDLAMKAGLATKGGAWYTIKDQKVQGQIAAEEMIGEIDGLIDDLELWLKDTGYSEVNENIKEAEKMLEKEGYHNYREKDLDNKEEVEESKSDTK